MKHSSASSTLFAAVAFVVAACSSSGTSTSSSGGTSGTTSTDSGSSGSTDSGISGDSGTSGGDAGNTPFGGACAQNGDCASKLCVLYSAKGGMFCTEACTVLDAGVCTNGLGCNGMGYCKM